jgi:hypothetical protein
VDGRNKSGHDERKFHQKGNAVIYELRIYHTLPGRLPALLKRFDTITLGIWERHGIKQAGFWTTLVGDSNQDLTYMLQWESLAEREKKWDAFQADPEWIAKRAETEKDGPINARVENSFLVPTSFSSVK